MQNCAVLNSPSLRTANRRNRSVGLFLGLNVLPCVFSLTSLYAQTKESAQPISGSPSVEILTPTGGVDFRKYTLALCMKVRRNWFAAMPEEAQLGEKGRAVVRFEIQKDGTLAQEPTVETSSTKRLLDKASVSAIRSSAPFQRLPEAFPGAYIELRVTFLYNLPLESPRSHGSAVR